MTAYGIEPRIRSRNEPFSRSQLLELLARQSLLVSRSTLERRFAEVLGRSPKDEILRVRLARVKQLLIDTDHPLTTIARLVGMEHHEYLSALFKAKTGETPGNFRKRMGRSLTE